MPNANGAGKPLTVVCFKWATPGYRAVFTSEHVNILRRMVLRHYPVQHRFLCITDDPKGLDDGIESFPIWDDHRAVPNPTGGGRPSCYLRLKLWAPEMAAVLGPRWVMLDLDCVITGDLRPLFDRPEDVVMWQSPTNEWPYNGAMMMANSGARPQVWEQFDPKESPRITNKRGYRGSDQAWLSHIIPGESTWGEKDGVWFMQRMRPRDRLPKDCRIVFTTAGDPPWKLNHPWAREHYR